MLTEAVSIQPARVNVSWNAILDDRAEAMLAALRAARDEVGRWPLRVERDQSGHRPSSKTFGRYLGGWREACWDLRR